MAAELMWSKYECNDQAIHIHIFYSKLLDVKFQASMVPNEEALFGTVGTTPIVNFNEWVGVEREWGRSICRTSVQDTPSSIGDYLETIWLDNGGHRESAAFPSRFYRGY
ncbi:hypothetical protein ACJ73_07115 [Blastomyces percursus]|uniref:Uncharacterized protein n=1 Tax=Blastomyces percursus TaxID=1658174 RepID=A0A1J9PYW7_9EURO|nr:hypothetical protein ACJ73_07115 [Blastomyces percursus]